MAVTLLLQSTRPVAEGKVVTDGYFSPAKESKNAGA